MVVDPRNVAHLADSVQWLLAEDIRNIALNPNFYIEWPERALAASACCSRSSSNWRLGRSVSAS